MSSVAVRPPRFLGERVPTREQTVQERLQESLPDYTVESSNNQYVAKAKPVRYLAKKDSRTKIVKRGQEFQYKEYVPHELQISSEGEVQKEVRRGTRTLDATGKIKEWGVYESEVTDYNKQTRFTYDTRDLKSGREAVKQTSSFEGGVYKEKRIIDQDTKEYEQLKRTPEQAKLIRDKGYTVRGTQEYAVAGLSKQQRQAYYRVQAQQRSAQLSLEAKGQKIAKMKTEEFRKELGAESQKFATNIELQQQATTPASPTTRTDMADTFSLLAGDLEKSPGLTPMNIIPANPASPTTRMDMADKPFLLPTKMPPGKLQLAPEPKGVMQRYTRYQDLLHQRQSRANIQGKVATPIALGASQFALGVPVGVYQFGKAVMPWNIPETVAGMVNPESYRLLGQQLRTRPAKTAGEIAGSIGAGYGLGVGIKYARAKIAQAKKPKIAGETATGQGPKTKDVQAKLPSKGERFTGRIEAQEMRFAKSKTGKGQIESTVFSAKVVRDPRTGKLIRTPEIGIVRHEIPGDPTRLGTIYQTKKYAYSGKPIRVRPEVQQPLNKPEVIATSKWLPGDVRPVVVKNVRGQPTPFVPDWTGGTLRRYSPQEFSLRTVYPKKPGLTPGQASAVNFKKVSYTTTYSTPYGQVTIRKPPTPTTQVKLPTQKPQVITIVRNQGPAVKPLKSSVVTDSTPKITSGGGSQLVTTLAPQKYATAGTVIKGTLKVYPKTQATPSVKPAPKIDLPDAQPLPKSSVPVKQSYAGLGLVGVLRQPASSSAPISSTLQPDLILQGPIQQPGIKTEPVLRINVTPDNITKSKNESEVISAGAQISVVQPATISQPSIKIDTLTEIRTETVLRTEPLLDVITDPPPVTSKPSLPLEDVPLKPPPELTFVRPEEERKKRGKYKVQVRQKGIFKDIAMAQTPEEAYRIGAKKVMSDSTASLRVQSVGSSGSPSQVGRAILPKKIFYESKKEPGVFIERRKFRIDAPKEKREITFKGILASKSRTRNIFKR